jgi:hypothetical protein
MLELPTLRIDLSGSVEPTSCASAVFAAVNVATLLPTVSARVTALIFAPAPAKAAKAFIE